VFYYVVNEGTPNRIPADWSIATHIMRQPNGEWARALRSPSVRLGPYPGTLCGLRAVHTVSKVRPAEVSCQECKSRWQLALETDAAEAARRAALNRGTARANLRFALIGLVTAIILVTALTIAIASLR
jgi:hypothetical protein